MCPLDIEFVRFHCILVPSAGFIITGQNALSTRRHQMHKLRRPVLLDADSTLARKVNTMQLKASNNVETYFIFMA